MIEFIMNRKQATILTLQIISETTHVDHALYGTNFNLHKQRCWQCCHSVYLQTIDDDSKY